MIVFGNWFAGESGISATQGLWRVAVPSPMERPAEPRRLATLGENIVNPAISRRGRRLAYAHVFLHSQIRRILLRRVRLPACRAEPAVPSH